MSSCLIGAGRNTAAAAAATYHEFEFLKSASASVRASPHSSSSSSCFTSSSPNSTLSESSNSICCRRKPRTPRKRPNQTYSEAAALLSTAYPNIFSSKHLTNPPSFKFSKPTCLDEEEILLPLLSKACEPRFGFVSNCWSEKPCESPMGFGDFDTESILDEEIEGGIDSIMGNLGVNEVEQTTTNFCYGIPMGLGLGFDFGLGMSRGVSAFRNSPHTDDDWWRFPSVNVEQISPTLEKKKSSSCCSKKKKKLAEEKEQEEEVILGGSKSDSRIQLKLNYDHVLTAWSDRGSPFSHDFDLSPTDALTRLAQIDLFGENGGVREASVMRYKEKRRTRLFSKKIRYQVRKVNADQRPRMKERFVRGSESSVGTQQ